MYQKRLSPPVHWHEGLFLQPHHFQQLLNWTRDSLTHRTRLISPYQWGVHRLEIEDEGIAGGRIRVKEIEAIFDDGLVLQTHMLAAPLEREFTSFEDRLQGGEVLKVYLAVANPAAKTIQIGEGDTASYPLRYRVQAEKVNDETTGSSEALVSFLKVKACLLLGEEDRSGYGTIPVAEILYAGGTYRQTDYIPPTLLVTKESPIAEILRKVCGLLRQRALEIAGDLEACASAAEGTKALHARLNSLSVVPSLLPLEQMLEVEAYRPLDFYLALSRLVGEVSILTDELLPRNLPRYNHVNLRETFSALYQMIAEPLGGPEEYEALEVEANAGSYPNSMRFIVKNLRPSHFGRTMCFVVRSGIQTDPQALRRWVESHCTIADRPQVLENLRRNFQGLERKLLDPPPSTLRRAKGGVAYQLMLSKETLDSIGKGEALWFVSRDPEKEKVERGEVVIPRMLEFYVRRK